MVEKIFFSWGFAQYQPTPAPLSVFPPNIRCALCSLCPPFSFLRFFFMYLPFSEYECPHQPIFALFCSDTHPTPPTLSFVLFHHRIMPVGGNDPNEVPKRRAWVSFSISLFCPRRDGKSVEGLATISWLSPFIPSAGMFERTSVEKNILECRVDRGFLWQVERGCSEEVWARIGIIAKDSGSSRRREGRQVPKFSSAPALFEVVPATCQKSPRRVQQMTLTSQLTRCTWATG